MMAVPILSTKLRPPLLPEKLVTRPHLLAQITHPRLLLISAPAGFGKTTLLTAWRQASQQLTAWVSLETADNDPQRFFTYLVTAVQTTLPGIGQSTLESLRTRPALDIEPVLVTLLNDMAAAAQSITLVLDDYHTIIAQQIHEAVAFLVDHAPQQLQLVILTRADPPLPLARWRARRQLGELRAADLRFRLNETTVFLNQVMGLDLKPDEILRLETRIEGWAAGLQLAALSMQGRQNLSEFIEDFSGSHQYIIDYLTDEVLNQQPEKLRTFLLQTSILDRLCAPLCAAVTAQLNSQALLEEIAAKNLFLLPLDDERRWYRYHHLFASVLENRLQQEQPDLAKALQRRAAAWHEKQGDVVKAVAFYLAGEDLEKASRLFGQHWATLLADNKMTHNAAWIHAFPAEVVHQAPRMSLVKASIYWGMGQVDTAAVTLELAIQMMEELSRAPTFSTNQEEVAFFHAFSRVLGSLIAAVRGDYETAVSLAQQCIQQYAAGDAIMRAAGYNALTYAYLEAGNIATAVTAGEASLQAAQASAYSATLANAVRDLGLALTIQGDLQAAESLYRRSLADAQQAQTPPFSAVHIALADLLLDRHLLAEAAVHLETGSHLATEAGFFVNLLLAGVPQARLLAAQGDWQAAYTSLKDLAARAQAEKVTLFVPLVAAYLARCAAELGYKMEAEAWLHDSKWDVNGRIGFEQALVAFQAAHVLLALGRYEEALALAMRIETIAGSQGSQKWQIEAQIVQALVWHKRDRGAQALAVLQRALQLNEAVGLIQPFLEGGAPMHELLIMAVSSSPELFQSPPSRHLLAIFPQEQHPVPSQPLVEQLSAREVEILGLVAAGGSNQQIAAALFLASGTVKKHLNNIYGKLGVQSRTQAVARARELELL